MPSFNDLSDFFAALEASIDYGCKTAIKDIGETIKDNAQRRLGYPQPGWPELAPWTQDKRAQRGNTPDDPLYETGAMYRSIHLEVKPLSHRYRATVYSDAPQALMMELGGVTGLGTVVPPRPWLAPAAAEVEQDVDDKVATNIADALEHLADSPPMLPTSSLTKPKL